MSYFKQLPVLDGLKDFVKERYGYPKTTLNNTFLIGTQHLLHTTGSLIEALIGLGLNPQNIFLNGKLYSTNIETFEQLKRLGINMVNSSKPNDPGHYSECLEADIQQMWGKLLEKIRQDAKIIILDDGGFTLKNTPDKLWEKHRIVGIEQTTSGARMMQCFGKFPVIMVATSQAKTILEPPIVAESVKLHLGKIFESFANTNIGIVGYGHIGKAIVKEYAGLYNLFLFDNLHYNKNVPNSVVVCDSIQDLYKKCTLIVGITGEDISSTQWLDYSDSDKTLMSLSSGDIEFNRFLIAGKNLLNEPYINPLQTLKIKTKNGKIINVLRGGMVANFTGTPDSAPAESIQLTRGLLFSSVVQALENGIRDSKAIKLDEEMENLTIKLFMNENYAK